MVTLEIKDNGLGFDTTDSRQYFQRGQSKGLGLISMRERAESVGGKLNVKSATGQGTHIVAELPLKADNSNNEDEAK
jgi:signal transduction histidine kinase